ncbi:parallel beta-helix repeat protein [Paraburkholderia sp. JPY158]|uniref:Parallel beta-helix repeat protein n=1 Tax=Paraburkholderia atlantica TaxID=2654982 RepID=A0A7W8V3H6_PARAM|nr:right-handed parallel beta-helix repeat-containing protein [Paraburkholderia atlantica]MBB5421871.1 parallel beta-helix repeat protein [Paraburkholderia atlantica]
MKSKTVHYQSLRILALAVFLSAAATARADSTVECFNENVLHISGNVRLSPQCRYTTTLLITRSNTVLDCQGATIDGEGKRQTGIEVDSQGVPLHNVEIRNCLIVNARGQGVEVGWSAPDRAKAEAHDREALYHLTPTDVRLRNVTVRNAGNVGIYIDDYVTHALIDHSEVNGSGSVGIYVEHSSRWNTVQDSVIEGNGVKQPREGIAIDSSMGNTVRYNRISGNAGGGIFLYRNCSEHYLEDGKQVKRWQSSDLNKVEDNDISGGKAGVWIASRQSIDLQNMQCGNGYYAQGKYTLDSAKDNKIVGNRIHEVDYGVIVEDDNNLVQGNTFRFIHSTGIKVGSIPRDQFLKKPVTGVSMIDNHFENVAKTMATVGDAQVFVQEK